MDRNEIVALVLGAASSLLVLACDRAHDLPPRPADSATAQEAGAPAPDVRTDTPAMRLYFQGLGAYRAGDPAGAISFLNKARTLEPAEPRIRAAAERVARVLAVRPPTARRAR